MKAKLTYHLDGDSQSFDLIENKEVLIGRSEDCDVELKTFAGISRKHLKVYFDGLSVQIQKLSSSGKLLLNGKSTADINMIENGSFSIPPYDFEVELIKEKTEVQISAAEQDEERLLENEDSELPVAALKTEEEKTNFASTPMKGRIQLLNGPKIISIDLDSKGPWVFGRDSKSFYQIPSEKASREHFEIFQIGADFLIRDLGSANGTLLNGHQLPANQEISLKTGDKVRVKDFECFFQVINSNFKEMALFSEQQSQLSKESNQFLSHIDPDTQFGSSDQHAGIEKVNMPGSDKKSNFKKQAFRLGILALIGGALVYNFLAPDQSSQKQMASRLEQEKQNQSLRSQKEAEDILNVALTLMGQTKFELCLSEINKLNKLYPDFKDAAPIKVRCEQGLEYLSRQADLERKRKQELAVAEKLSGYIVACESQVSLGVATLNECLQPALALDPSNEKIQNMMDQAQEIDRKKADDIKSKKAYQARLSAGKKLMARADKLKAEEDWDEAIKAYNKFIKSKYPDPGSKMRTRAKLEITSIKTGISSRLESVIAEAKKASEAEDHKTAIRVAKKGLRLDRYNKDLSQIYTDNLKTLEVKMQSLYQEAIIEEDLGQIDLAYNKWKDIIDEDTPDGKYFKKAKYKLSLYPAEAE